MLSGSNISNPAQSCLRICSCRRDSRYSRSAGMSGASMPAAAHSAKARSVGPISTRSLSSGVRSGFRCARRVGSILRFEPMMVWSMGLPHQKKRFHPITLRRFGRHGKPFSSVPVARNHHRFTSTRIRPRTWPSRIFLP